MFRKSKKLSPPPTAPTLSEILSDLETFQVAKRITAKTRTIDPDNPQDGDWWRVFETFLQDVEDFKKIRTDINGHKIKLESLQLELDATAKNIRSDIEENLQKTQNEIKD